MPPFTVPNDDGGKPTLADALVLNLACFSAIPCGLLVAVGVANLLPEWVIRDGGLLLAFGLGVPPIVGFGLLFHRALSSLLAMVRARRRRKPIEPSLIHPAADADVGTLTIRRVDREVTLRANNAAWMFLTHPGGKDLVFGIQVPSQVVNITSLDPEGYAHPGAELVAFLPVSDQPPPPLAIVRDLEDPFHRTSQGHDGMLSFFRDDDFRSIDRFKFAIDLEKSGNFQMRLTGQARTSGGEQGHPAPVWMSFACQFLWKGDEEVAGRTRPELVQRLFYRPRAINAPQSARDQNG